MSYKDNSLLRIVVSGIKKGRVQRRGRGIIEEDDLGMLFRHVGCKVAGVRLVIDSRSDASRGFAFVDFEDYESLELALTLRHTEANGLAGKDGRLCIDKARTALDEKGKIQQELLDARNQTKEMERELAFHEDRLNKLVRKVQRKRERQNQAQAHDVQLQEEKRRQAAIRQALNTIKDAKDRIRTAIEAEERRVAATGAIKISVDGKTRQRHQQEGFACVNSCATSTFFPLSGSGPAAVSCGKAQHNADGATADGAVAALTPTAFEAPAREESAHRANPESHPHAIESTNNDPGGDALGDYFFSGAEPKICVRNTFIELWVPERRPLRRTNSVPPMLSFGCSTRGTAKLPAEAIPPCSTKQSASTTEPTSAVKADDEPAPWVLRHELSDRQGHFSAADVSRALLEEKMGGPSSTDGSTAATTE